MLARLAWKVGSTTLRSRLSVTWLARWKAVAGCVWATRRAAAAGSARSTWFQRVSSAGATLREAGSTSAPSSRNRRQRRRPMKPLAPVTSTLLPW